MRRALILPLLLAAMPASAQTLLVGNKGEDTVSFVDVKTGRERARVPTGRMPHEIAISPDRSEAAVVAYGGTGIDVFDVRTAKKLRTIDIAPNARPHGLLWLADGRLVATAEGSQTLVVVGRDGVKSVATGQPSSHMVAVSPDASRAYVANIRGGTVSVIDLERMEKVRDLAVGGEPEGIAVGGDGFTLYVGDLSAPRLSLWDLRSSRKIGEIALPAPAIRVLATPQGILTSSVKGGGISLIRPNTRTVAATWPLGGGAAAGLVTILATPDGRRLYAAETGRDRVAEIDLKTGKVLRRFAVGKNGDGLGYVP